MRIFDTHTHIFLNEFDADRADVVARAADAGVSRMMLPNVDVETIPLLKKMLADESDGRFVAAMGLHPTSVGEAYRDDLGDAAKYLNFSAFTKDGEVAQISSFLKQEKVHVLSVCQKFRHSVLLIVFYALDV